MPPCSAYRNPGRSASEQSFQWVQWPEWAACCRTRYSGPVIEATLSGLRVESVVLTYSVKKLPNPIELQNATAFEGLKFERTEESAISDDISSQSIVVSQGARLCQDFGRNLLYVRIPEISFSTK